MFAVSDEVGAAVVNELQRRGLRVPEEVSVPGFDNTSTLPPREPAADHHGAAAGGGGADGREKLIPPATSGPRSCRTHWSSASPPRRPVRHRRPPGT
nr:substrate-binding domain-containing protein [Arthrobacter sp. EPSL27]